MSRRNLKDRSQVPRPSAEVSTIPRQVDLRVHDREALDEIELYTEVLSAVAASEGPLSRTQLDEVLGVTHAVCRQSLTATQRRYITSAFWRIKPSDSYILTAAAFDSSTYSITRSSPRWER